VNLSLCSLCLISMSVKYNYFLQDINFSFIVVAFYVLNAAFWQSEVYMYLLNIIFSCFNCLLNHLSSLSWLCKNLVTHIVNLF